VIDEGRDVFVLVDAGGRWQAAWRLLVARG
jgi:hypothetical protein